MGQKFGRLISEVLDPHSYLFQLIYFFRAPELKHFVFAFLGLGFRSNQEVYLDLMPFAPHLSESYSFCQSAKVCHQTSSLRRFVVRQHLLMTYFVSLN